MLVLVLVLVLVLAVVSVAAVFFTGGWVFHRWGLGVGVGGVVMVSWK
ncbi:hypothetical protein NGM33_23200 [Nocardiopsis dassonvillei]|nr:hypothetical protein [Nocardiopsis dassonvillei]MCP3016240.1 hypothetical protein [Nocardiopsis dassonvillei]